MPRDLVSLGSNLALVDELYARYREDESSVEPEWRALFEDGQVPERTGNGSAAVQIGRVHDAPSPDLPGLEPKVEGRNRRAARGLYTAEGVDKAQAAWPLVNSFRVRGHMVADLDPLEMREKPHTVELEPSTYGFTHADLDREISAGGLYGKERGTLREILECLRKTYCRSIGLEFMHISVPAKKAWLAERMECWGGKYGPVDDDTRRLMLEQVVQAEALEQFCHVKYPGTKRFSLEGSEALVPVLDLVLTYGARLGAIEAVLGMAHRGRLNVLHQIMQRRARDVFAEFEDIEPEAALGGGDVKYHMGYSTDREDRFGRHLHLSLAFNPSHLEAVDPVVVGRVRAKQRRHGDWEHRQVMGVLVHGDAAFAGQGIVPETLNLANLHGFRTGGTVHLIVNNQIGFTASPQEARSTPYCTDVAKMLQCPIFHVNGDDLDACAQVVQLAMEYRDQFQNDVVIDIFCYRKFGHNEMDEPGFTQPLMYERIRRHRSVVEIYGDKLVDEGLITGDDIARIRDDKRAELERELEVTRATQRRPRIEAMRGVWSSYVGGAEVDVGDVDTGVPRSRLEQIAERITTVPEGMKAHRKIVQLMERRAKMGRAERPLDWGMAELLAYGSLLWDGSNVRFSGQDSARGTFSHRHALITDIETGYEYMLLGHLHSDQGLCRIYDSPLSEVGVLGFEFGFSLDYPDALVIWEAQFGDFANGAQVIIDQFICASEDKWNRLSGLTMLLPHGYEGQGPEHSSARLERFLQLCAEDNLQVCQPTTPAQMFHLLRRQVVRPWRKPLIVLTPKSLLRHPEAVSDLDALSAGRYYRVLADPDPPPPETVEQVLLCSGKLYYELVSTRSERTDPRTAIVRIEQFFPWRPEELTAAIEDFSQAREYVWVQEEPRNMGAHDFLMPRLAALFGWDRVRGVSREASASPATGSGKAHALEQAKLIKEAFDGPEAH
jgi:2-oxoglutarate dehydrogenase E1 component